VLTGTGVAGKEIRMRRLAKIGVKKNWVYEVIVSTFHDKNPHAAPMGVWTEDFDTLNMEIYKDSKTLKNIMKEKEFAANLVADITIFYECLFNKGEIAYENSKQINAPVIKNSAAIIELKVKETKEKENRFYIQAEIVDIRMEDKIKLINRAESLVLESLILATKIPYLSKGGMEETLKENYRVVGKVAPGSKYENIMEQILTTLNLLN
jgi:hypothetical protein